MATAVWSVPARLTSAVAALLSKQINQDEALNHRRQVLEEQLRAASGSESSLVEVDVDLDTAKDLFDILCGLCLELDTENALHENELVTLEGDCLVLQKKVAVLQSQLRRRGPDHQDGNGPIHYTTEEHISESGKIKTVLSATPVLPYEEPTAPGLDTTTAFPQSSSQPDVHGNNPQSYRAPSPPPKAATPPFDTTSSSQTLDSDSISTPQVGSVLLSESTNSQAPRHSSKCPPPTEPLGASPTNARKRRRTPSTLSSYSTSSTRSRRGRSTSRSGMSEMSISTQRTRRSSPGEGPHRSRSRSMAGRGRSARPRLRSPRARSTSQRFRPTGDGNYRERQNNNHRGGTRRSRRRAWSRSPPAKRMKTGRDYRHRRPMDTSDVGLSRHRSRSGTRSSRSPSLEQRLRYPRSPAPLYRRQTKRSPSPLRGRSSATGSRYDDERDGQYRRQRSRDRSSTLRHRDDYHHYRGRSPRHLDPSPLPSRPTSELPRLPHARSGERSGAGQWERVANLPPRSDGKAGKHIVWVRKDHLPAPGAEQGARPVSEALPPTSPRDRRLARPPQQVTPMNQGPESRGGLGPHWDFHKQPRNSHGYRGPGNYESNWVRGAGQPSSSRPPHHPPPSRPLADRVSSSKGPEGPTRPSPPSLAARISPVRPMRILQVSHGLLQRSPLKFANGRLGRQDNAPPKATGANQVPVSNLNSRTTGIPGGSYVKSADTGGLSG